MIEEIGLKIRNLRTAADLTQEELADRADLTDGFISQVERGKTSISIDSLKQILDALNVHLSDFFREEEKRQIVFGDAEQTEIDEGGTGRLRILVSGATNRRMEPALLDLPAGTETSLREPFQGDCFGFLLKGRALITFGGEHFRLKPGQCFYFTADREYRISNPTKSPALVLWLTAPPTF